MHRTIKALHYNMKVKTPGNDKLISLANEFAELPEHAGISSASLIRNFLIRKLQETIDAAKAKELAAAS